MERAVAIKKLGKLLGKSLGYRVDPTAPTREQREAAQQSLHLLTEEKKKCEEAMRARREAVLAADEQLQSLTAAYKAAREAWDRAASMTRHHKFTVGTSNGMFFHVKAEGDSWEEVIDQVSNGAHR